MSAAEGQHLTRLTLDVLLSLHDFDRFTAFYEQVVEAKSCFAFSEPALPRKRRASQQFEVSSSAGSLIPPNTRGPLSTDIFRNS